MPASQKLGLIFVVLGLAVVQTVVAFVCTFYLLQGYFQQNYWFFAAIVALAACQDLIRTYWTAYHTKGATFSGASAYLARQSVGMYIVPLLAFIGNAIGGATGFNSMRGGSYDTIFTFGTGLGAIVGLVIYIFFRRAFPYEVSPAVIRGSVLSTLAQAQKKADALASNSDIRLPWGGIAIPESLAENHFLVVGATGSGKTPTITQLMKAVLPRIGKGSPLRALVYDAKRDVLSVLREIGVPSDRIRILNPFDARCDAWDIAKDITSPATTSQLASILVPQAEGPNRFFSDAARAILAGIMDAFILTDTKSWTLRDVVVAMQDHDRLRELLSRHPATRGIIGEFFNRTDTLHDIRSTIASYVAALKPIAALWSRSTRKVSLEEWASGEFVLVLGNDDSLRAPLDAINRVLFQRMSEILTRSQQASNGLTWIFIDELKEAGRFDSLPRLMSKSRTFGVRAVLGFQDLYGLTSVYGQHAAQEIADAPKNKAFLQIESIPTCKWAAEAIGEAEIREYRISSSSSGEQYSEQIYNRSAVLASELKNLPLPDTQGYPGYVIVPSVGVWRAHVPYGMPKHKPDPSFDFNQRDPKEQYLDDWNDDDFDRLGISKGPKPPPTQPPLPFAEPPAEPFENPMPRLTRDPA